MVFVSLAQWKARITPWYLEEIGKFSTHLGERGVPPVL
jgi:hypothetical protein